MTIKQLGGIFGRNPEFNDIDAESLNVSGTITSNGLTVDSNTLHVDPVNNFVGIRTQFPGEALTVNGNISFAGTSRVLYNLGTADTFLQTGTGDVVVLRDNGGTETARFNSAGIGFPSGKGIDFSATSGTGTSELFDDYEEGESGALTMTPQTSGTITLNTSYDTFKYTKIGNRVTISGQVIVSSVSSPVGTKVTLPLPFTSVSGQSKRSGTAAYYYTGGGVETLIPCGVLDGATDLTIHLDASTIVAGHEFWFDVTYQAA
jgi:hypothetical protein